MILEAAIANISRNLELLIQKDGQGISTHSKLKEQALECLESLIKNAPRNEYRNLISSEDYELLLKYLINILTELAKNDKSKPTRIHSTEVILSLIERLEEVHNPSDPKCSVGLFWSTLPGISSKLFRLLMCDTKLPKKLLVNATKIFKKIISLSFANCGHESPFDEKDLKDTCENFSIRFSFLINYITDNSRELPQELSMEMIDLCMAIVIETRIELMAKCLQTIVKFLAFMSSVCDHKSAELELKLMLLSDSIKDKIQTCDNECDNLDYIVVNSLIGLLDSLEENGLSMLPGERFSKLALLHGFLKLTPSNSFDSLLELEDKRRQLFQILDRMTEFSSQQPFLFLTDAKIDDQALEKNEKIYTVEKKFAHLERKEIELIVQCCYLIGQNTNWFLICDILQNELGLFLTLDKTFIAHQVLKGFESRDPDPQFAPFLVQILHSLIDQVSQVLISINNRYESVDQNHIIGSVVAIETIVTSVRLYLKFAQTESAKTILLRPLLCPLLHWSSCSSRAISENSLSALFQISQFYEKDSIKSLIEANIDYIVDGISVMLDNFSNHADITSVLATTLKLSSIDSFYYFKDIYEKVFKLLGLYHQTEKAKHIALLFYRTLNILNEWQDATRANTNATSPLRDPSSLKSIKDDLDINMRIKRIDENIVSAKRLKQSLAEMEQLEKEEANKVKKEVDSCKLDMENPDDDKMEEEEPKKVKTIEVLLTEKILSHSINLLSSNYDETKILALKAATCGFSLLQDDEDTLLPLVHKLWSPLVKRLAGDYNQNLEINLCAFECLSSMAFYSKDFIKGRTLDNVMPRICLFLESQARLSRNQKDYGPYCMTLAYKCQLKILHNLGAIAYNIQLAYTSLWRVIKVALIYLSADQVSSLRNAAKRTLEYLIALDADCVWYFAKQSNHLHELPFELMFDLNKSGR